MRNGRDFGGFSLEDLVERNRSLKVDKNIKTERCGVIGKEHHICQACAKVNGHQ